MKKSLTKFRRDRWRDKVIVVGERLRELQTARAGINSAMWPDYAAYIDADIDRLERKRDKLLRKIKETAPCTSLAQF